MMGLPFLFAEKGRHLKQTANPNHNLAQSEIDKKE
jgi:hypothetical protein